MSQYTHTLQRTKNVTGSKLNAEKCKIKKEKCSRAPPKNAMYLKYGKVQGVIQHNTEVELYKCTQ